MSNIVFGIRPARPGILGFEISLMSELSQLEDRLGVQFQNKALLEEACTHRSYLNEHPEWSRSHNERLEFLGDAVLELIVTQHLFEEYPKAPEGELTNLRAALVRAETLADVARGLNVNAALLLSRGEAKDTGRARDAILANAMEAIIGAIFLDQGMPAANEFIERAVLEKLGEVFEKRRLRDAKSRFQELAQETAGVTPHYSVMKEWGPDHARHFQVGAYIGDQLIGSGEGPSKQDAQQAAAAEAMRAKGWV